MTADFSHRIMDGARAGLCIAILFLGPQAGCGDEPPTTPAPLDPLLGSWQLLSLGEKKVPPDVSIFWTFDEKN
ncbi:MAG: hypothetical protein WED34_00040, partial [Planctomycetales bacterium]